MLRRQDPTTIRSASWSSASWCRPLPTDGANMPAEFSGHARGGLLAREHVVCVFPGRCGVKSPRSRNLDGNDVGERDATVGVTQRLGQRDRVAASGGAVDADQHVLERGRLVRVVGHRNELFGVSFVFASFVVVIAVSFIDGTDAEHEHREHDGDLHALIKRARDCVRIGKHAHVFAVRDPTLAPGGREWLAAQPTTFACSRAVRGGRSCREPGCRRRALVAARSLTACPPRAAKFRVIALAPINPRVPATADPERMARGGGAGPGAHQIATRQADHRTEQRACDRAGGWYPWGFCGRQMGLFTHSGLDASMRGCTHRQRSTSELESRTGN